MQKLSKKIIVNVGIYEDRVAITENGRLEEFYVEQEGTEQLFGNIYKGIVDSIVPGIGAAFVNIGTEKNAFLYIDDIHHHTPLLPDESEGFIIENSKTRKTPEITSLLKNGQEIVVQVEKESIGTKGPRITTHLSIPGRYLVLTPFDETLGISKRVNQPDERNRIKSIINQFRLPHGMGCIVRTAARGVSTHDLKREIKYLLNLWSRISYRSRKVKPPAVLYEEYGLIMRMIRDQFTENIAEFVIDSKVEYKNIIRFLNLFMPALKSRISFYNDKIPVFEKYGIEKEIEKIFRKKILLRNGGSIIIEQTEGMVAIDVNTARYVGRRNAEDTVFRANLEAAREIARQIRLRDIGGIIIIDFIDMRSREHKSRVQDTLDAALRRDKAKTKILSISPIGVVEMTRQRMRRSLESAMYRECPYCHGRGLVKRETTIVMQVLRKIERESHGVGARHLDVWVHPQIYDYIMANERDLVMPLRRKCRKDIKFYRDATMQMEDVRII